jgi:hypothetical protein
MQRFQISGSVPEPTCEWSRVIRRRWRSAIVLTSSRYSCQIPKLAAGPPVLVRLVEPVPSPGFIRTDTSLPGATRPKLSSWWMEHALNRTPRRTCSASRRDGIWEVSWISAGANPAWIARSTSKSLDASMWRPSAWNTRRMPRDGFAFIA